MPAGARSSDRHFNCYACIQHADAVAAPSGRREQRQTRYADRKSDADAATERLVRRRQQDDSSDDSPARRRPAPGGTMTLQMEPLAAKTCPR